MFAAVTFFVLFPDPFQFARHISRICNLEAMIEPAAPELGALEAELRSRIATTRPVEGDPAAGGMARAVQRDVERFVLERVAYEWDWNLWGAADYMPTIAEMFGMAESSGGRLREDCDGRAVLAASLMRRLGHDARLVTDLRHVWVVTNEGAWMGPGERVTIASGGGGNEIAWFTLVSNIPTSLSFGIAVFPFWREVIILLTAYLLMLHRRMSRGAMLLGLILLVQGLLFLRLGYLAPVSVSRGTSSWPAWVGLIHVAAGFAVLLRSSHRARRGRA